MAEFDTSEEHALLPVLHRFDHIPELKFIKSNKVTLTSVGDGNLNDVIRVEDNHGKSIIVKHAPPYIKVLGPEYPLEPSRGDFEYQALVKFHQLAPGSVPVPYFYDKESSIICMEDLRNYKEYREELMAMRCEEVIVRKIAEEIAIVHTNTHKQVIGEQAYQHMVKQFTNPSLMSITDQYVFTRPFTKDDETNRSSERVKQRAVELVYSDPNVIAAAKAMQEIFHNKKECLVHGDLHTESIMNTNNDCKIIDLEFAFVGPPAVDIGFLLANYMFSYYGHMSNPENHDERRKFANSLIDTCKLTVSTYLDNMPCHEGDRAVFISDMLAEIAGFAGCELVRRTVGAAHVKDIEGNDDACIDSMGAGVRLLLARERIHTVDKLMVIALMLT